MQSIEWSKQEHAVSERSRDWSSTDKGRMEKRDRSVAILTGELTEAVQKSAARRIWCQYGGAWMIAARKCCLKINNHGGKAT